MRARTQAMQDALDYLNKEEFANFVKHHDSEHTVRVGNGEKKIMRLNEAMGLMFDRQVEDRELVKNIYEDTAILRDVNTFTKLVRKYKFVFGGGIVGIVATVIRIWVG